jgi:RNA polymerase sigma-70 factor (ECF subfamily)
MRALRAMHRLREGSNMRGWLITILRNLWLNHLRSRSKAPKMLYLDAEEGQNVAVATGSDPLTQHTAWVDAERVHRAVDELPLPYREIILLREFEELSYQEIAEIIERPVGTVMSRLARARSQLRDALIADSKRTSPQQAKSAKDRLLAENGHRGKEKSSRRFSARRKPPAEAAKTRVVAALAVS